MLKKRKVLLKILFLLIIILVAIYSYLFIDTTPPLDCDLSVNYPQISPAENAATLLISLNDDLKGYPEYEVLDAGLMKFPFNEDLFIKESRIRVKNYSEALEKYDGSFKKPKFRLLSSPRFTLITQCRPLLQLSTERLYLLFKDGREEEAVDEIFKQIQFGRRVYSGNFSIISTLNALGIVSTGHVNLYRIITAKRFKSDYLRQLIKRLSNIDLSQAAFQDVLREEYQSSNKFIEAVKKGLPNNLGPDRSIPFGRFLLCKNETKSLFASGIRVLIKNLDKPLKNRDPLDNIEVGLGSYLLPRNITGRILYTSSISYLENSLTHFYNLLFSHEALKILLAISCFKNENGNLPTSLNDLVPEYFEKVPLDPFDGEPIRYSSDKKILYSIGKDLQNSGGNIEKLEYHYYSWHTYSWNTDEPTIKISF